MRERSSRYGIRSINLALRLLERLAEDEAHLGTTELARQLGENKWRVFRHLHSLREEGYVEQDAATERFQIGAKFYQLASKLSRRFRVASVARPELVRLQETLGHSVVLAGLSDGAMIVLDGAAGNDPVKIVVAPGTQLDFPSSAVGKVALAFGPEELMQGVLKRPLRALTDRTITDRSMLRREIAAIRAARLGITARGTPSRYPFCRGSDLLCGRQVRGRHRICLFPVTTGVVAGSEQSRDRQLAGRRGSRLRIIGPYPVLAIVVSLGGRTVATFSAHSRQILGLDTPCTVSSNLPKCKCHNTVAYITTQYEMTYE